MKFTRTTFFILCLTVSGAAVFIYKYFNPVEHLLFPKCPIKQLTGFDCPGCGGQRAFHHALNGEFRDAFFQNPLLFVLIPYIILGFYLQLVPQPTMKELKIRKILYGYYAIQILFFIILAYTILRNLI